jgi:hypothetical protein
MTISIKNAQQNEYWLMETINEQIKQHFTIILKFSNYLIPLKAVQNDEISPFAAAQLLLQKYFKSLFSGFKCQLLPPSFFIEIDSIH